VGFVFAPSPRRVSPEAVRQITAKLPRELEKYGIFVDAEAEEIISTVAAAGLTGVQIHRSSDDCLASRLREHLGKVSIFSVVRYQAQEFERQVFAAAQNTAVDGVLVDSFAPKAVGGTGVQFDWSDARPAFRRVASQIRIVLAGGLKPENVKQAVETLQPWGVDVVSGVESEPGKKDPARVRAFIEAAQQAAKREELRA
jgi:phosphoribosylanthranilate isomerase